jgi:hypothetical protein
MKKSIMLMVALVACGSQAATFKNVSSKYTMKLTPMSGGQTIVIAPGKSTANLNAGAYTVRPYDSKGNQLKYDGYEIQITAGPDVINAAGKDAVELDAGNLLFSGKASSISCCIVGAKGGSKVVSSK